MQVELFRYKAPMPGELQHVEMFLLRQFHSLIS